MSLIPSFFGNRRSGSFDPFSLDLFPVFPFLPAVVSDLPFLPAIGHSGGATTAFGNSGGERTPIGKAIGERTAIGKSGGERTAIGNSGGKRTAIGTSGGEATVLANPRIDWKETPAAHVFEVEVPGLKKEEVKVGVDEGSVLQISGERSKEKEQGNEKWHLAERSSGKFLRRFRLPENAMLGAAKAGMGNGVLTVVVPKEEEVKEREVRSDNIFG